VRILSNTLIFLAGLVNLAPLSGLISASRLQALYGFGFETADLLILMRHRAILFGIVGSLLVASVFHPPLRAVGIAAGLVSMLSFVVIVWLAASHNAELARLAAVDLAASIGLIGAALLDRFAENRGSTP
jgi:hypothetical protein